MTHPIFAVITIILALVVILCLIYEPLLIKWEDKQRERLWRAYKERRKHRK